MKKQQTLTLKRLQKRHKENPQDAKLHKAIEKSSVNKGEFEKLIEEATKHQPFDKKR